MDAQSGNPENVLQEEESRCIQASCWVFQEHFRTMTGEAALWISVVERVLMDAQNGDPYARVWLFSRSGDLRYVSALAELDPEFVERCASSVLRGNRQASAAGDKAGSGKPQLARPAPAPALDTLSARRLPEFRGTLSRRVLPHGRGSRLRRIWGWTSSWTLGGRWWPAGVMRWRPAAPPPHGVRPTHGDVFAFKTPRYIRTGWRETRLWFGYETSFN
jgi:hypothetical protein